MTEAPAARVLLVDDDEAIISTLGPYLERAGFEVAIARDGEQALQLHPVHDPDIVVSDVLMPGIDGRELVRRLRRSETWTPVILLTQVDEASERAAALDEGADDYLGKPFLPSELVSRIRAVLRRTRGGRPLSAAVALVSDGLELDRTARRLQLEGRSIELTPKAIALLDYPMAHPGEVHTREHLLATLWGFEFAVTTRAVDHRIAELRRALREDPQRPRWIETVQGAGYRFCASVTRAGA